MATASPGRHACSSSAIPQAHVSQHPHPLNLPEILALIATFLQASHSLHDLASCAQVSSLFHEAFTPVLYSHLDLRHIPALIPHDIVAARISPGKEPSNGEALINEAPPELHLLPFQASLRRYGHLVRSLRIDFLKYLDLSTSSSFTSQAPPRSRDTTSSSTSSASSSSSSSSAPAASSSTTLSDLHDNALSYLSCLQSLDVCQHISSNNLRCQNDRLWQDHQVPQDWQNLGLLIQRNSDTLQEVKIRLLASMVVPTALWMTLADVSGRAQSRAHQGGNTEGVRRAGGGLRHLKVYGAIMDSSISPLHRHHSLDPNNNNNNNNNNNVDGGDKDVDNITTNVHAFLTACRSLHSLELDYCQFIPHRTNPDYFSDRTSLWNQCRSQQRASPLCNLTSLSLFGRTTLDIQFLRMCLQGSSRTLKNLRWATRHHEQYLPARMTPQISQCIIDAAAAAVTITAALDTASRQPENPQQNNSHQHSSVPDGARGLLSLQSLDLWDGLPFTDTEIACILDALTVPLQVLSVPESGFGELATAALFRQPSSLSHAALVQAVAGDEAHSSGFEGLAGGGNSMLNTVPPDPPIVVHPGFYQRPPHAATLKRLDLTDCPDITDDTLQRIKDMCPVLKTLIVSTP